jgi:hypothetical protein
MFFKTLNIIAQKMKVIIFNEYMKNIYIGFDEV